MACTRVINTLQTREPHYSGSLLQTIGFLVEKKRTEYNRTQSGRNIPIPNQSTGKPDDGAEMRSEVRPLATTDRLGVVEMTYLSCGSLFIPDPSITSFARINLPFWVAFFLLYDVAHFLPVYVQIQSCRWYVNSMDSRQSKIDLR